MRGARQNGVEPPRDDTVSSGPSLEPQRMQSHSRATSGAARSDPSLPVLGAEDLPVRNGELPIAAGDLPVAVGDLILNKYEVERVLGRGGAGVVVAARNVDLDERVALKFLRPDVAEFPDVVARFAREAKAAVSIKNEHVCKVLDVGTLPSGAPFMVMEYLEGRDLYRVMRERGALPVAEAVEYVLQVCEALSYAHARGVVHRDIKPENIFLLEPKEGIPYVKVLDFGISKRALTAGAPQESLVKTGGLLGTPAYMSPEQIRSTTGVDARTDIWALGVVLYELLTARAAFKAESVPQMAAAILELEPAPVREVRPEVPAALVAIVERCLSKKREDRPRNVAELAALLLPFAPKRARISVERATSVLQGTAMASELPPPMPAEVAARPARRVVLAVAVLGLVIGTAVLALGVRRREPPPAPVLHRSASTFAASSQANAVEVPEAGAVVAVTTTVTASASAKASVTATQSAIPTGAKPPARPTKPPKAKGPASAEVDLGF